MKTSTCDGIGHVGAELPVGCTGIDIGSFSPVAERIDFGIRAERTDIIILSIALTDDCPVSIQNELAVTNAFL